MTEPRPSHPSPDGPRPPIYCTGGCDACRDYARELGVSLIISAPPPNLDALRSTIDAEVRDRTALLDRALVAARSASHDDDLASALDAAYRERNAVVAALVRTNGWPCWVAAAPDADGWVIAYAETPEGQVSWHVGPGDFDLIEDFPAVPIRPWDGHTTEEKYRRVAALRSLPAVSTEPRPREDNRYVWLIERGQPEGLDRPQWWGVTDPRTGAHGWLGTVWPADQFETRAEAEAVIARYNSRPGHPFNARAVEHAFVGPAVSTEPLYHGDGDQCLGAECLSIDEATGDHDTDLHTNEWWDGFVEGGRRTVSTEPSDRLREAVERFIEAAELVIEDRDEHLAEWPTSAIGATETLRHALRDGRDALYGIPPTPKSDSRSEVEP